LCVQAGVEGWVVYKNERVSMGFQSENRGGGDGGLCLRLVLEPEEGNVVLGGLGNGDALVDKQGSASFN
jgi:hypothetical protein